jgi:hypothetical protein
MFRHEIGVLTQAITRALDLDDDGVMEKAIEQCGGDDGVAEDLAPFGKAAIGRQNHGAPFVAGIDELEEQIAAAGNDRQVTDLVDDRAIPSLRQSSAMLVSPRSPSRTMRIFSSAEYWRRVARRMSLTVFSALSGLVALTLIVASVGVTMSLNLSLTQSAQSVR